MPRLSDETRLARRIQISEAAVQLFAENGFAATPMSAIIAESGLSAGSIYSHFQSKADLIGFSADRALNERGAALVEYVSQLEGTFTPADLLETVLSVIWRDDKARVMIQVWAEAPRDERLQRIGQESVETLVRYMTQALLPWARSVRDADPERAETAEDLAARVSDALLALAHGFLIRSLIDPGAPKLTLREDLTDMVRRAYG